MTDGSVIAQQRDVLRLGRGAAAEGNDARLLLLDGFAQNARELFVLDSTEFGLAHTGEYLRNCQGGYLGDALVEVDVGHRSGAPAGARRWICRCP